MNYNCDFCQDTGSMHHDSDLLDCVHCEAAVDRAALNEFIRKLGVNLTLADRTWAIHQRALAMAPKQEIDLAELASELEREWLAKKIEEMRAIQFHDGAFKAGYETALEEIEERCTLNATADANGATTGHPLIGRLLDKISELPVLWGLNEPGALLRHTDVFNMLVDANREQIAAAGPNAALIKAPEEVIVSDWPACNPGCDYEDPYGGMHDHRSKGCTCEAAKGSIARQRAALSGAKGN